MGSRKASLAACVLAAGLFTACLVTNKVDYDEAFIPSVVERADPRPGEFTKVPPDADEECKRTDKYMQFAIRVRDLNRQEQLQLQYVVNHVYAGGAFIESDDREYVSFCVAKDRVSQPCNLVEALVSSEFDRDTSDPYDTPNGDLSSVHWWVIGDPTDNPAASYLDCPDDVRDAGGP